MLGCELNCDGNALGKCNQGKPVQPGGICHGFKIGDMAINADIGQAGVGQTGSALVVSNEGMVAAQCIEIWPPDAAFPVHFQVRQEMAGAHDPGSTARGCIRYL